MTREEAYENLGNLPCYDEGACDSCEDCDFQKAVDIARECLKEKPHGTCKTCKYYVPYKDQFSYRNRGDGYCKSTVTTSEGQAYINCHNEWFCANYEKGRET